MNVEELNVRNKMANCSRRSFLKSSAAVSSALALPAIVPSSVFGANAPSNKIPVGCIGIGKQGSGLMGSFVGKGKGDSVVIAACDVDAERLESARVRAGLDKKSCYNDFRELIARKDIDAVAISTPDHWHALMSVAAIKSGKDVYCEKPLTLTIAEGRALANASRRYGRVVQTGSQQRSSELFRRACELVRNGRIGKLHTVKVDIPGVNRKNPMDWKPEPVPEGFDYNMWLGQATDAPYHPMRCHYSFRFILDYSGGQMTNWGAHYLDIAQWGIGADDSGPLEIEGKGEFPKGGLFTTAEKADIVYTYANNVKLILNQRKGNNGNARFEGTEGWISVNRKRIDAEPKSLLTDKIKPNELHLYKSNDHKQNFLDCIKTRNQPVANAEIGHRSASVCHLGNIAMLAVRKLKWDPKAEQFIGDAEANSMVSRVMRSPWHL